MDVVTSELDELLRRAVEGLGRPVGSEDMRSRILSPTENRIGAGARDVLLVLLAAVGLLLLVSCSNVANLLLARGAGRARGFALRAALGASAWRLVRALFAECLVLALAAALVGVALGWATLRILVPLRPNMTALADVQIDATVVAFTFGLSAATALLFGLAPALQLKSRTLADALRHGASGTIRGGGGQRLRKWLVVAQMAMSVVLLVSAGLLVRSVIYLQNLDLDFEAPRFNMALLIAFAVIGLVLAAVGLAAAIGYEVTERTHEFGVRMALGARTENVQRLAMKHGLIPALAGVVLGVIGGLAATRLAASMLYGVEPRDPLTFAAVVVLLMLVALGAAWLPARRATRVEPMIALRAE